MLNYRVNRPNQPRTLANSIDGFTNVAYQPRPIQSTARQADENHSNKSEETSSSVQVESTHQSIVSEASSAAKNIVDLAEAIPEVEVAIEEDSLPVIVQSEAPVPFGLATISNSPVAPSVEYKVEEPKKKLRKKIDLKLKSRILKIRKVVSNIIRPPWTKLRDWEEFRIFSAGAALAAGLIVLGFYLGFNRPLSIAESVPTTETMAQEQIGEVLAEHVVKEPPVVKETSDGQKVEVSQGINPNEVDRRPPAPVDPSLPVRMRIPSIKVNAPIRSVGLLPDKTLAVPNFVYQVGWYDKSPRPGEPGTMLMDGHYGVSGAWGVFSNLKNAGKGAEIEIIRGDGQTITYIIEENLTYEKDKTPMDKAFARDDKQRLSIVTCDGTYLPALKTYSHRRIVYAVRK